jgi:hypothetical protein
MLLEIALIDGVRIGSEILRYSCFCLFCGVLMPDLYLAFM